MDAVAVSTAGPVTPTIHHLRGRRRCLTRGYLDAAQRDHRLATTGPYAWVRHPQYAGFVVIMIGFLFQWPTLATLVMFPVLVWFYVRLARREEAASAAEFGEQWQVYARSTPAFIPRFGGREAEARHDLSAK